MEPASVAILLWIGSTIVQLVVFIVFMRQRDKEKKAVESLSYEVFEYRNQIKNINEFFTIVLPSVKGE